MSCPSPDQLQRLLDEALVPDVQQGVQAHLEACPVCQRALERLVAAGPSWDRAARHLGGSAEPTEPALEQVVAELQGSELSAGTPPGELTQGEAPPSASDELPFLDPSAEPGHLGRLGNYEVLAIVGRGGMGVVLKARDERLHRIVAIKVLGPQYAASASARRRFEREAKAAAAVSHDHVVPIYHVDEHRGTPFLVMPLIGGKSLQERIEQDGPLELKEILRIGSQAARGLAAAHKQGLVHRDIKPANILLENGVERVKITDFGLARAVDDASVTQSGVITGTPMFMSPEQARGEFAVDARSDLFSLGSVLYVMATGRPPFRASGTHAVLRRVIDEAPRPLREVNADLPDWLEAIVAKLHAKRPEDRFQTAEEVADLLEQHLAHLQQPHRVALPAPVAPPALVTAFEPERPALPDVPGVMEKLFDATDRRRRAVQLGMIALSMFVVLIGIVQVLGAQYAAAGVLLWIGSFGLFAVAWVKQRWDLRYRGHAIRVENSCYRGEALFIDNVLVARGGFGRRVELRGVIRRGEGVGDEIVVLCASGLRTFRCRVYAEREALPLAVRSEARPARRKTGRPWVRGWASGAAVGFVCLMGCGACVAPFALFFGLSLPPVQQPVMQQVVPVRQARPMVAEGPPFLKKGNWVTFFNGKDLAGWDAGGQPAAWQVKGGVLNGAGKDAALATTKKDYRGFHLALEVQIGAGDDVGIVFHNGNNKVRVHRDNDGVTVSVESLGQPKDHRRNLPEAPGAWIGLDVICEMGCIDVKVNGRTVVGEQVFVPPVPGPAGPVVLQSSSNGMEVRFRSVRIRELTAGQEVR